MKVYFEPNHQLPMVSLALIFPRGASSEALRVSGLARICARMLRRGSKGWDAMAIEERLDELGADWQVGVSQDATYLYADVIARNFEAFTELLGDMLKAPLFDEQELQSLLRKTSDEVADFRNDDGRLAGRGFRRGMFESHPYAQSVIGTAQSMAAITRQDVVEHYRGLACFDHAYLALSGDLTDAQVAGFESLLKESLFAEAPAQTENSRWVQKPGAHLVFVDKPARSQVRLIVGTSGAHPADLDYPALHLANTAFGGTFSSPLTKEIRVRKGWSYGAQSYLPLAREREALTLVTAPGSEQAAPCLQAKLKLLRRWVERGLKQQDISLARNYLCRSHVFDHDTPSKRVQRKVAAALVGLPEDYYDGYVGRLKGVSSQAAEEAVAKRVNPDNVVISAVGTYAQVGKDIERAIPNLQSVQVLQPDFEG